MVDLIIKLGIMILGNVLTIITNVKLITHRINTLEKKVEKHNNIIERVYRLEGCVNEIQKELHDT